VEIYYLGHACFKIKGREVTIITDPYSPEIGLKLPKNLEADIVTTSHGHYDHAYTEAIAGNFFKIGGPGEYEVKGIFVTGIPSFHDKSQGQERGKNTIYVFEIDGFRLCHLGDLGHELSSEELEAIGEVDVLFIPVGGNYTISAKEAANIVSEIEPRFVIPMHYKVEGSNLDIEGVEKFCQEMGAKVEPRDKFVLTKPSSSEEEKEEVVILKVRNK